MYPLGHAPVEFEEGQGVLAREVHALNEVGHCPVSGQPVFVVPVAWLLEEIVVGRVEDADAGLQHGVMQVPGPPPLRLEHGEGGCRDGEHADPVAPGLQVPEESFQLLVLGPQLEVRAGGPRHQRLRLLLLLLHTCTYNSIQATYVLCSQLTIGCSMW